MSIHQAPPWNSISSPEIISEILEELVRFAKLATTDLRSLIPEIETWFSFPHPSREGSLITSKRSSAALDELVKRSLSLRNLERRIRLSDLKNDLGSELVKRFIAEARPVDQKQADRLLSWAAKRAEGRCSRFTYYYPLRFTFNDEPKEIDLGPVKLRWLRQPNAELFGKARSYLQTKNSKNREWSRRQLREALDYYKSYKWYARVEVAGCDEFRSEEAAYDVLTAALDCLHFLIGRQGTYRLAVGKYKISNDTRALVWFDSLGAMTVRTSHGSLDVMGFKDGWSADLTRPDVLESVKLIRLALECRSDRRLQRPLSNRFLDAARWFGEAVRDRESFSKVVKFTTAVERLVVAGKFQDVSETVATRIADLTIESDDIAIWGEKKDLVKRSYALRSALVHGSVSPHSSKVSEGVKACGDIAEELLYVILHRYGEDGLLSADVPEKKYAEWFDGIRDWVSSSFERVRKSPSPSK